MKWIGNQAFFSKGSAKIFLKSSYCLPIPFSSNHSNTVRHTFNFLVFDNFNESRVT